MIFLSRAGGLERGGWWCDEYTVLLKKLGGKSNNGKKGSFN